MTADMILKDGLFTTLDRSNLSATAAVITNSFFPSVGREQDVMQHAGPSTRIIELGRHRALPSDRASN
jgi:predicted amidohydrolase YtcJ